MQNLTISGAGAPDKDICMMFLSCIGEIPRYFLHFSDNFLEKFEFRAYIYNNNPLFTSLQESDQDILRRTKVLIHHPAIILPYAPEAIDGYEVWLKGFEPDVQLFTVSQPFMQALWPFHSHDPRNLDEGRKLNRFGHKPKVHYGDSFVTNLITQGLPPRKIFDRYMNLDLKHDIDIDLLYKNSEIYFERQDKHCSVRLAGYIAENFRGRAMFQSINHPNNDLMFEITNQILRQIGCKAVDRMILERTQELQEEVMPVHPRILKHFGCTFADGATRYNYDYKRKLNFGE